MSVYLLAVVWEMPNIRARCSGSCRPVSASAVWTAVQNLIPGFPSTPGVTQPERGREDARSRHFRVAGDTLGRPQPDCYQRLSHLTTTGIALTTPAAAAVTAVMISTSATRAYSSVRTANRRQVDKDRGRHVRAGERAILEAKPQLSHPAPVLRAAAPRSVPTSLPPAGTVLGRGATSREQSPPQVVA